MIIRIKQYQFSLSEPYQAGHQLSESEAQAMNALRAENIRNAFAPEIQRAIDEAGGELLAQQRLIELEARLNEIEQRYHFSSRKSYRRFGAIETEARNIARARVLQEARGLGLELSEDELEVRLSRAASQPEILEEARHRMSEAHKIANEALEDL